MWPTNSPPAGFLICNGALVPAATYPQLAAILGSSSGNVTLPDYRDRFPVGAGPTMSLGTKGGSSTVPLSTVHLPAHSHGPGTLKVAAHGHNYGGRIPQQGSGTFLGLNATHGSGSFNNNFVITDQAAGAISTDLATDATAAPAVSTGVTANAGGDTAHENRPPYQSVNFIIRAAWGKMPVQCNVQISFEVETADDVNAAIEDIVCPAGAQVMISVNETTSATVPEGGGAPVMDEVSNLLPWWIRYFT
jgi:microcystin-dependent protein